MSRKTALQKLREAQARGPVNGVLVLEDATREDMLHLPNRLDSAIARRELQAAGLMEAPTDESEDEGTPTTYHRRRDVEPTTLDVLGMDGFHVVDIDAKGALNGDGGITSHRGVLHPAEYVDEAELKRAIEDELGFTYDQIRSVYRQGPLAPAKRELRDVIDARMLALRRAGANMTELGRAIGFPIRVSGNCAVLDNAVSRARAIEQWKANQS